MSLVNIGICTFPLFFISVIAQTSGVKSRNGSLGTLIGSSSEVSIIGAHSKNS